MKKTLLPLIMLCFVAIGVKAQTTIFKQDFNSSENISDYILGDGATPDQGKFTALQVGNATNASVTIVGGKLHFSKTNKSAMGFSRSDVTNPGFAKYTMEFAMSNNSAEVASLIAFSVGTGFNKGVQLPQPTNIHSLFYISPTTTSGQFTITAGTTSATFSGTQNITFFVNNTGGPVSYKSLSDGTTDIILDNDKSDLWVGNNRIGTAGVPSNNPDVTISDFRLSFINTDTNPITIDIDNLEMTELQTVLPVSLLAFTAEKQTDAVILKWSTASEKNNSHFDVLRSTDGKNFEKITRIDGAVNSEDIKEYSFKDVFANAGINYYQLKQVDLNGNSKIYGPVAVNFGINGLQADLVLHNKSTSVDATISNVSKAQKVKVSLYNVNGVLLSELKTNFQTGTNQISIPVSILNGVHIIHVSGEDFHLSKKFMKSL